MKVVAGRWDPGGFRQLLTNPPVAVHLLNAGLGFQLRAAASSSSRSRSALTGALVLVLALVLGLMNPPVALHLLNAGLGLRNGQWLWLPKQDKWSSGI